MKPWYFEGDCLFCTRSASSFCHKPLYFLARAMWVKWWCHAILEAFQSSFQVLFNFMVLLLKIISKCMKNNKWSQKGLKIDDVALNGAFWTQKNYGVQISLKKWNPCVLTNLSITKLNIMIKHTNIKHKKKESLKIYFQSSFEMLFNFRVL